MKRVKRLIISLLLGTLTLSLFAFTGCKTSNEQSSNEAKVDMAVLTSYASTTEDGQRCLEQEVVATISGVSSITQPIDLQWSLYIPPVIGSIGGPIENPIWGDKKSDYIILESTPYDETTQTSTCILKLIKAIPDGGVIDLNVNCNNNKISKSIEVKYVQSAYDMGIFLNKTFEIVEENNLPESFWRKEVYIINTKDTVSINLYSIDFFGNPLIGDKYDSCSVYVQPVGYGSIYMKEKGVEGAPLIEVSINDFIFYRNWVHSGFSPYLYAYLDEDSCTLEIQFNCEIEDLTITATDENGYECDYEFYGFVDSFEPLIYVDFIILDDLGWHDSMLFRYKYEN